ncbi:MAG: hypothetical protein AB1558_12010, partial [Thermodesulfobacteriota bacterium]
VQRFSDPGTAVTRRFFHSDRGRGPGRRAPHPGVPLTGREDNLLLCRAPAVLLRGAVFTGAPLHRE